MILLSQRDPKWAAQKLGKSDLTIGRYGCTTTAISMLSDYFGSFVSPASLARQIDLYTAPSSKTSGGLILWPKLNDYISKMTFEKRVYVRNDDEIKAALKDPKRAVILEVNNSHWVTAMRPTYIGNSYKVADPWFGDTCDVISRYKNITGAAFFKAR